MRSIIVFIVAILLGIILIPVGFVYSLIVSIYEGTWKEYLWDCGVTIDQTGNTVCKEMFDDLLIHNTKKYYFGKPDETVSSVIGKNERINNLTWIGKGLNWVLDKIEYQHSLISIEEDE